MIPTNTKLNRLDAKGHERVHKSRFPRILSKSRPFEKVAGFTLGWLLCVASVSLADTVHVSTLFNSLTPKGYAAGTTGGLGGELYTVTSRDDSFEPGTLRYALEVLTGPVWIVFCPDVFPPNVKKPIYIDTPLNLLKRDNVTIDGRGSHVSIRKIYDFQDAVWTRYCSGVCECTAVKEEFRLRNMSAVFAIRSAKNIIITHLDFLQIIEGDGPSRAPNGDQCSPEGVQGDCSELDKQCFKDVIVIDNATSEQQMKSVYYDNIWINQCTFDDCADECISIAHPSSRKRAHISISHNLFKNSYKGILIGNNGNPGDKDEEGNSLGIYAFQNLVSVYNNRFVNVKARMPRAQDAIAHVFNNVFENWDSVGVGAARNSRVMVEENVFRAISQPDDPWVEMDKEESADADIWARNNIFSGVTNPGEYVTSSFPGQNNDPPWYYDDSVANSISHLPYQRAIDSLRVLAGWRDDSNDVRLPDADCVSVANFIQGNANGDGGTDMADAITVLGFLFLGDVQATCRAAFDANGDGAIDISDATTILGNLFLGEPPTLPGGGQCQPLGPGNSLGCGESQSCGA